MESDRQERADRYYRECHQMAIRVLLGEDMAMDRIADELAKAAKKYRLPLSDAEIRKEFLRVFLGILWQRLESVYRNFSENAVFEERLDVWADAFLKIRRPIALLELINRHMKESPRLPLLCDIYQQLKAEDMGMIRPAETKSGGATPGLAQRLLLEWKEKRQGDKKCG